MVNEIDAGAVASGVLEEVRSATGSAPGAAPEAKRWTVSGLEEVSRTATLARRTGRRHFSRGVGSDLQARRMTRSSSGGDICRPQGA